MISALLLFAALGATVAAPSPEPLAIQGVAVLEDGTVAPFTSPAALKQLSAPAKHAWIWSEQLPPLQVMAPTAASLSEPRLTEGVEWRVAEMAGGEEDSPGRLISAPVAMWEEVPESLLPSRPVAAEAAEVRFQARRGEPWRIRYVAADRASDWLDIEPHGVKPILVAEPAVDWRLQVVTEDGEAPASVRLSLLESDDRGVELRKLADFRDDPAGRLEMLALPRESDLLAVVTAPGTLPRLLRGRGDELPRTLQLPRGATVTGVVQTPDRLPLAGAQVEARTWLDGSPIPLRRVAQSDPEGRWRLDDLPVGRLTLFFRAEGAAPLSFPIDVTTSPHRVGEVVLPAAHLLHLEITDTTGLPLAGEVRIEGRQELIADSDGKLVLQLVPGEPFDALVSAPGYRRQTLRRFPPLPVHLSVRLEPAVVLHGRFLDAEGVPVGDGRVELSSRGALSTHLTSGDGSFEIQLASGGEAQLRFTSPRTAALELSAGPGVAGQRIDLGDVTAPPGVTVSGWLRAATTGEPVAGARVWTPRPGPRGLQMAWALGDRLEGSSDAAGSFSIGGLPVQPLTLRIEARGFAPLRILVMPQENGVPIDLGEIVLPVGADLIVTADADGTPSSAVLDLGGLDLELDRMTAPFRDGEALLRHVPAGTFDLAVLSDGREVCRATVAVEEPSGLQEVVCEEEAFLVRGTVEVGGRRVGPGVLRWIAPVGETPQPDVILNTGGDFLRRQRVFAGQAGETVVEVDAAGGFETSSLRAGEWLVLWQPEGGAAVGPQRVTLGAASSQAVALRYPGLELHGTVVDDRGRPVGEVQVRSLDGSAFARSEADGSFVLGALSPGAHRIQARDAARSSEVQVVHLEEDGAAEPVILVLDDRATSAVAEILDDDERPLAGAVVFFDLGAGGMRLVSADSHGRARAELPEPFSGTLRIAAFHDGRWALGSPLTWHDDHHEPIPLALGDTGSLHITTAGETATSPRIVSSTGWDLTTLHSWLGHWLRVSPEAPLRIGGLPPGSYEVEADDRRVYAAVTAGDETPVRLER